MDTELLMRVLAWVSVINYTVLIIWFLSLIVARNFVYKLHSRWFDISEAQFNAIHYGLMGAYKLLVMVFFLTPYIVLRIVT